MLFYYVLKDGQLQARFTERNQALDYIHALQKMETHPILKSDFTIIQGFVEESVKYER